MSYGHGIMVLKLCGLAFWIVRPHSQISTTKRKGDSATFCISDFSLFFFLFFFSFFFLVLSFLKLVFVSNIWS
jgi:hypothetical protein